MKISKQALSLALMMNPSSNGKDGYGYVCLNGRLGCIETGHGANALRIADKRLKSNFSVVLDYDTASELVSRCQGEEIVLKSQGGHEWYSEGMTFCDAGANMEPYYEMRFLEREGKINESLIPAGSMNLWRKLQTAYGLDPTEDTFIPKYAYSYKDGFFTFDHDGEMRGKFKKVINLVFCNGDLSLSVELKKN